MNNKIKLAVAGAVLSAASMANAGIIIPAGDWTLDVNGNVNAFMTRTDNDKNESVTGGTVGFTPDNNGEDSQIGITTGLLPAWLGFTGTTSKMVLMYLSLFHYKQLLLITVTTVTVLQAITKAQLY